jgi:imidazolonepropionase
MIRSYMKIFTDIAELLTLEGADIKQGRRVREEDLSIVSDAALVCKDGKVEWAGPRAKLPYKDGETVSLKGATVIPGLIECHTHTVFAGDRSHEFEWRQQGQTYQEISAKGGGILSTVKATRAASEDELVKLAQERTERYLRQGVTTLETKSGYGLDLETELKCLRTARRLKGPRVISTYLGAHSRSPDHPDLASYMKYILSDVLPRVAREKLADRVDIYVEKGFYGLDLAQAYWEKARELGLPITAHVEQLSDSGGTKLALEFRPQSVDHVVYLNAETVTRVARSETTAVLLPTSDFYLKMRYPPARELLDQGARVALSSDYNPGTSPTQDVSLTGVLARLEMKMSLAEVISAYTVGAAWALGRGGDSGALVKGKHCDFAALDCKWRELFYSVGYHPVRETYVAGHPAYRK